MKKFADVRLCCLVFLGLFVDSVHSLNLKDVQMKSSRSECALRMGLSSINAAVRDVPIKSTMIAVSRKEALSKMSSNTN